MHCGFIVDTVTPGFMLDPSVFLAERTLGIAISEIEDARVPVVVPGRFLDLAREPDVFDRVGEFFGGEEQGESGAPGRS